MIKVVMDPEQRKRHNDFLLSLVGLSHIPEDENAAYCHISLTNTPDNVRPFLAQRQKTLAEMVLTPAEISAYDPSSAPFSPDKNLRDSPTKVTVVDSAKIAGALFFTGHYLLPSTGEGVEEEKASNLTKVSIGLFDKNIRVSRMQSVRTINLCYKNFEQQINEFQQVFRMLKEFNIGAGFEANIPILIGWDKRTGQIQNLEKAVYESFPNLRVNWDYMQHSQSARLTVLNPEIFYESG